MKKIFLSPEQNRQLIFSPKILYDLVAERGETNQNRLQIPYWCTHEELNLDFKLRKLALYPLSYGY